MEVRAPSGMTIIGDFGAVPQYRPYHARGLAIPRTTLDHILLQQARTSGAEVIEGERVTDLIRNADGAVSGVRSLGADGEPRAHNARIVIGADGLRSIVARRAKLAQQSRWPRRIAFVTHFRGVSGVGPRGEMLVERDGYMGIAVVGDGSTNVSLVLEQSRFTKRYSRDASGDGGADVMMQWIAGHPHIAARFSAAERVAPVQATGPFASRATKAWAPGVALVGDAADFFDPFTGEGMYSALLGAESLAHHVPRSLGGDGRALPEYDRWRRAELSPKWRVEWLIAIAVANPWWMERAARAFARRPDLGHLLVGVTGDFVPAREVLRAGYIAPLILAAFAGASLPVGDVTHA
jgi:flavin-dependent dehydrogenase